MHGGNQAAITGTLASTVGQKNPYRYRSYRYDNETGLYYLQSRYYNPEWGRFLNADDANVISGSLTNFSNKNLVAYCDNNPVMNVDPSGFIPINDNGETLAQMRLHEAMAKLGSSARVKNSGPNTANSIIKNPKSGNFEKVKDSYLKDHGLDAHAIKKGIIKGKGSDYDLYADKKTGDIYVFRKGLKGEGQPTGYNIKRLPQPDPEVLEEEPIIPEDFFF